MQFITSDGVYPIQRQPKSKIFISTWDNPIYKTLLPYIKSQTITSRCVLRWAGIQGLLREGWFLTGTNAKAFPGFWQ